MGGAAVLGNHRSFLAERDAWQSLARQQGLKAVKGQELESQAQAAAGGESRLHARPPRRIPGRVKIRQPGRVVLWSFFLGRDSRH